MRVPGAGRVTGIVALVACLGWACGPTGPVVESSTTPLVPQAFGGDGSGEPATPSSFGDRHGPRAVAWADSFCTRRAPTGGRPLTAPAGWTSEPEALIGSVAIYTATPAATVAYDLAASKQLWKSTAKVLSAGSVVSDGHVVCGPSGSDLACLDFADGHVRWSVPADDATTRTFGSYRVVELVVHGSQLFAGATAYSLSDGTQEWSFPVYGPPSHGLAFVGGDVVVGDASCGTTNAPCLVALDGASGSTKASVDVAGAPSLLYVSGATADFYVAGSPAVIERYDASTHAFTDVTSSYGALASSASGTVYGVSPLDGDGTLYVGGSELCRWNLKSHTSEWCVAGATSAVRIHPNAVFAGQGGIEQALSPDTGQVVNLSYLRWFGHFGFHRGLVVSE